MPRFILKRLVSLVLTLLFLTAVMFVLQRASKIDPVLTYLGRSSTPEAIAQARHRFGFDRPLVVQYVTYVGDVARGNLHLSLYTRHPVADDLRTNLPATLELMAVAMVIAIVGGAVLGIASALRVRGSSALRLLMVSGAAAPSFLLGLLGVIIFYKHLGWLPATGRSSTRGSSGPTNFLLIDTLIHGNFSGLVDAAKHLVMPAFCLAVGPAVAIGRVLRGSLMTTLRADFIATARAKGLREVVVIGRHGLRNAAAAPIQMTGLQIGFMFASVVIVEQIFSWPGVGSYMSQALVNSDFPAVVGVSLLAGTLFVVLNALVDIIQTVADRRVALG